MQSSLTNVERIRGIEVLAFDHVELTKTKLGTASFVAIGALSVVYFPKIDRFVLYLGEWEYALLKRLPVTSSSRTDTKTRIYTFPTYNGFYTTKINKITHLEAIQNFETILSHYSKFSYLGEDLPVRQVELSPDVSLIEPADSDMTSVSSDSVLMEESAAAAGHQHLRGKDKLKRGFAKIADKLSGSHAKHQKDNLFLSRVMEIQDLINPNQDFAEVEDFGRKDVEHNILKSKDIAAKMLFGASPNELQVIDTRLLKESITDEAAKEKLLSRPMNASGENMMSESVIMTKTIDETGREILVDQSELDILNQIEQEKKWQEEERRLQEFHRQSELALIEQEREIRARLRAHQENKRVYAVQVTEQKYRNEIEKREEMLLEGARLREADLAAFEARERELVKESTLRLEELRAKEAMTEAEHAEMVRREGELKQANARIEALRREAELREAEVRKTVTTRMEEIQKRMNMTESERTKLRQHEEQLEKDHMIRLEELKNKTLLTENERIELLEREESLRKLAAMKEAERLQIIQEREELVVNSVVLVEELKERQKLTETELAHLRVREQAVEEQAESIIRELSAKEQLTEAERMELETRKKELTHIAALREAERVELVKRQEELAREADKRAAMLIERQRLTEAEMEELEKIRIQLQKESVVNELERRNLTEQRNRLLEEAEARETEINRRISMTESERLVLQEQEERLEADIQRKLAELRLKEDLTEGERYELQMREKELVRLHEMKKMETAVRTGQLEKLREQEEKLLKQNMELIEGHKQMQSEIVDLTNQLEKPIAEVRETKVETVEQTKSETFDVTSY